MDSFRVISRPFWLPGRYSPFNCEELESETLRLEAVSMKSSFFSLLEATQAAVELLNQSPMANSLSLWALRVTEDCEKGEFGLFLLFLRMNLSNLLEFLHPAAPARVQASAESAKLQLVSENRYARLYSTKDGTIKEYKWWNCESVNRALTEAVILLSQTGSQGPLLQEIKLNDYSIQLLLRTKGTALREDIKLRRKRMDHYSEELMVSYMAEVAERLNSAHIRVIAR